MGSKSPFFQDIYNIIYFIGLSQYLRGVIWEGSEPPSEAYRCRRSRSLAPAWPAELPARLAACQERRAPWKSRTLSR